MATKVICYWETLMRLASELGQARLSGDPDHIARAQARHDSYRDACLRSDEMVLPTRAGEV